jgi:hypothetical protein
MAPLDSFKVFDFMLLLAGIALKILNPVRFYIEVTVTCIEGFVSLSLRGIVL